MVRSSPKGLCLSVIVSMAVTIVRKSKIKRPKFEKQIHIDNYENITTSKKNKTKGVEENTKARCAKWDDYAHIKFIELCKEEIRKGNRPGSYLSKDGWRNLVAIFNQMTGRNYDKKQMKNH
ncbi:Myb/SANT-like domain [Dillenia turbinata]|uniref:Myb/SANT-like domain n=1 Tax=Dillenia turbinata TaxID=194707 RepID=A0AAN8UHP6_9MAGN